MRYLGFLASVSLCFLIVGCSDDSTNPSTKKDSKISESPDGGGSDQATTDGNNTSSSALQVVVNALTLPKNADEYAVDLDSNGSKDNRLGGMMGALVFLGPAFNAQGEVDKLLSDGTFLMLMDVQATSITDDANAKVQALLGQDLDNPTNPADNFSGNEELGIDTTTPQDLFLAAKIAGGKLEAGPGKLVIPLPIGTAGTTVTVEKSQTKGTLSAQGITDGQINGAIPQNDVDTKLIPGIAGQIDIMYKDPATDPIVKGLLAGFDTSGDGTIGAEEIKNNALIAGFLQADVDTDGDQKPDALSVGLGFTAVPCVIKR